MTQPTRRWSRKEREFLEALKMPLHKRPRKALSYTALTDVVVEVGARRFVLTAGTTITYDPSLTLKVLR